MRIIVLVAALAVAVACAPKPEPVLHAEGAPYAGKLTLPQGEDIEAVGSAFAKALNDRYGARAGVESVKADLMKQGFLCRDVPPVEARPDYLVAACELPKPHGLCSDLYVVSLRFVGNERALDHTRVRPDGSFERTCTGPAKS